MRKHKKILLIVSIVAVFTGVCMMLGAYLTLQRNADNAVAGLEFEEKTLNITDPITSIHISTINSSIELLPSPDGIFRIVCDDSEKLYHQVSVTKPASGAQLNIHQRNDWPWYEMLYGLFRKDNLSLQVYLPESEYVLLHADSSSGDITVAPDFRFQTVYTYTASGNTRMTALSAENLNVCSVSGDLILHKIEAAQDVYLESISGFMQIEALTATNITAHGSRGSTVLQDVSSGTLRAAAVSGDIHILGGRFSDSSCFETGSGSIEIVDSSCGEQALQTVSGAATLQNVSGSSLNAGTSSGTVLIEKALYSGGLLCRSTSGEIMLAGTDAGALELFSSSGDISGNLLSSKNFITETSSGYVDIPRSDETAGTCHISTVSGNINIAITP